MNRRSLCKLYVVMAALVCLWLTVIHAGWLDIYKPKLGTNDTTSAMAPLSQAEIASGLKEVLSKGVNHAIANLGKDGGFLNNADVTIPVPPRLQQVEKACAPRARANRPMSSWRP